MAVADAASVGVRTADAGSVGHGHGERALNVNKRRIRSWPPHRRVANPNGRRASGRGPTSSPGCGCCTAIASPSIRATWYIAAIVTCVSFGHTLLRILQGAIHGRAIRATKLTAPPIFIIGHWRTGTTLLHELLVQDERFAYPTTYACMDPCDFLLTEWLFSRLFWFLVPSRRPMDNMKAGFDRPQEDEFALCFLGRAPRMR